MNIWKASSVEQTPSIEIVGWKIFEVSSPHWEGRSRHLSGYNVTEWEGRASSHIQGFDKDKMNIRTKSGRVYHLSDEKPRLSMAGDASYVWEFFIKRNDIFDIEDVTDEYK